MSLKTRRIIKNIIKITTLSFILVLCFLVINSFLSNGENREPKTAIVNNKVNYKNTVINPIANVGVAITSNIGIGLNKENKISETNINNKIFKAEDFYNNSDNIKRDIIVKNMVFIKEYYNILKINWNETLEKSKNKEKTLNNIIKQLEIRFKNANTNVINLNKQRELLISEHEKILAKIANLKNSLEIDFAKSVSDKVFKHVENYYDLKYKEINLKTNIIFMGEFLKRYNFLNNYNKILLDTLINNKDIISKDSYIVIPNSGSKLLKDFNLIFSEDEYKQKNNK